MVPSPPIAAQIWSWLPTLSLITCCSSRMASLASSSGEVILPRRAFSAFSSPTVNEEEEPSPERAGRSPMCWTSMPSENSLAYSIRAARTEGCMSSRWSRTSSICE